MTVRPSLHAISAQGWREAYYRLVAERDERLLELASELDRLRGEVEGLAAKVRSSIDHEDD